MSDDADPAQAAREVFQGPDFWWKRIETPTVSTSWIGTIVQVVIDLLSRMSRGIGDLIGWLLRHLFGRLIGGSPAAEAALWVFVALLMLWALWRLWPVVARWIQGAGPVPVAHKAEWQALAEPADLFDQAGEALRGGGYAEAIRMALLALIARLEKQGRLRYDASRTNREYQRELRHAEELAADFGRLARIYDRVWYGGMPAGRDEAERAIDLCRSMIAGEGLAAE
jgi:hypothetical protein